MGTWDVTEAQKELVTRIRGGCLSLLNLAQKIEEGTLSDDEIFEWLETDISFLKRGLGKLNV